MPDDYLYDVFLSYKRHKLIIPWIIQVKDELEFWLNEELDGKDVKIFFDSDSIEVGDNWPERLREGLKTSRCMIGIWSPTYFYSSRWCVSEWKSFIAREKMVNMEIGGLVAPITVHDGDRFPQEAKDVQQDNFVTYYSPAKSFWETTKASELSDKIRNFAEKVAKIVINAPPFDPNWPVVEAEPLDPPDSRSYSWRL